MSDWQRKAQAWFAAVVVMPWLAGTAISEGMWYFAAVFILAALWFIYGEIGKWLGW